MQNITALSVEQVETALKIAGRGVLTVGSSIWSRNLWIALVQTALFSNLPFFRIHSASHTAV